MSSSHFPVLNAISIQLLVALRQYEVDVSSLSLNWQADQDMDQYLRVSRTVDSLRNLCAASRDLSSEWVSLLISHTELMHTLWRVSQGAGVDVAQHLADHLDFIQAVEAKCRRLASEPTPMPAAQ